MFHWICPECGREIPPAVKECPACDPSPAVAGKSAEPAAVASPVVSNAPEPAAAAPPIVKPDEKPVESAAPVSQAINKKETSAPVPAPAAQAEPEPPLDPLLALAEQIRAAQSQQDPKKQEPAVEPPAPSTGLPQLAAAVGVAQAPAERPTVPAAEVTAGAPAPPPLPTSQSAQMKAESVALLAPPEQGPAPQQLELPQPVDLVQPVIAPAEPPIVEAKPEPPNPEPAVEPPPAITDSAAPPEIPSLESKPVEAKPEAAVEPPIAVKNSAAPPEILVRETKPVESKPEQPILKDLAPPPEIPALETKPVDAKPEQPMVERLTPPVMKDLAGLPPESAPTDKPPSGSWLQLAPLQDYSSAATRAMQPAAPRVQILSPDAGPRITLPGPTLPAKLERLQDAAPVTVIGEEPKRVSKGGMPGWLISLMLMLGIPIAGAAVLFYFQPIGHSSADVKAPAQEASATAPDPAPSHSLSQFIEVTGFRIIVDYNKRSEIHYLVVNHSAADLSDMTIYVTLRAAGAKPGQAPISRFSFRAPGLGPFESKEMTSPIERVSRAVTLPEWQDLRAEVQIGQ